MDIYRPNVGIVLFNRERLVLIARRIGDDGPETIAPGLEWQMPQGGIDPDEEPEPAARRELREETGITSVRTIGATADWLHYDWPPYCGPPHRLSRFKGQRQLWFAMLFEGDESEIDLTRSVAGEPVEFSEWRWERLDALVHLVVPFKKDVYRKVAREFASISAISEVGTPAVPLYGMAAPLLHSDRVARGGGMTCSDTRSGSGQE